MNKTIKLIYTEYGCTNLSIPSYTLLLPLSAGRHPWQRPSWGHISHASLHTLHSLSHALLSTTILTLRRRCWKMNNCLLTGSVSPPEGSVPENASHHPPHNCPISAEESKLLWYFTWLSISAYR